MTERTDPHFLIVAEVLRPHGVRGEVRVRILTDYPERIEAGGRLFLGQSAESKHGAQPYTLERVRLHDGYGILKFEGIDDRSDVETWRAHYLMVPLEEAVPLAEDEFYTYQLIGMTMVTESGRVLGEIRDIMETGANDVYIVDSSEYGELLVPEVPDLWVELDFEQGFATVRLPEGLLPF